MVVYRELSSLVRDLGVSARVLYGVSNRIPDHYHLVTLEKGNGEPRLLYVPDPRLKAIQRRIAQRLLCYEEVSRFAMAYRIGGSTLANARPHVGRPVLLKLDIRHFFDHILYPMVKDAAFPAERYSESNRILLSLLCVYRDALVQGAPTSPVISNIILRDFDETVGEWCRQRKIHYTRYCDDMTFSGDLDPSPVHTFVADRLREMGFFLNEKKTVVAKAGQKQLVTGLVVNDKVRVPASYRKRLRQELYFCQKYGVRSHMERAHISGEERAYLRRLLGQVQHVLSADREDPAFLLARDWLLAALDQHR